MWLSFLSNLVSQKWLHKKSRRDGWHKPVSGFWKLGCLKAIAAIDFPVKTKINFGWCWASRWEKKTCGVWMPPHDCMAICGWPQKQHKSCCFPTVQYQHNLHIASSDRCFHQNWSVLNLWTHPHQSVFPLFDGKHRGISFNTPLQYTKNKMSFNPPALTALGRLSNSVNDYNANNHASLGEVLKWGGPWNHSNFVVSTVETTALRCPAWRNPKSH